MKHLKLSTFIFSTMIFLMACQSDNDPSFAENENTPFIAPPFSKAGVEALEFIIQTGSDTTVYLSTGSSLDFPAGCFVDENDKPLSGEVIVKFTEYRTPGEILMSGIPMKYSEGDLTYDFQSAGMFELRAFQSSKDAFLAKDKSINVNMTSKVKEDDYNFYYLDERGKKWMEKAKNVEVTVADNTLTDTLATMEEPVAPNAYHPETYTFDVDIPYNRFPQLKSLAGVMWQYAGSSAKNDPKNHPELVDKKWNDITLEAIKDKPGKYQLTLANHKSKYIAEVVPVLRGKALKAAEVKFNKDLEAYAAYQKSQAEQKERMKLLAMQAEKTEEIAGQFIRQFQVKQMGIYNYDRQLKVDGAVPMFADFDFKKTAGDDANYSMVFLITGNGGSVIKYPIYDWDKFAFVPQYDNKIIAVMPGDYVYTFSQSDFDKIDLRKYTPAERKEYLFKTAKVKTKIESSKQLDEIIASL